MKKVFYYILFLLIFVTFIFGASFFLQGYFRESLVILGAYAHVHPISGVFLFMALAAASVMLGPFTSAPLVPFAVAIWGPLHTSFFLLTGWLVGNSAAYLIGYGFGYPIVRKLVSQERLEDWSSSLSERVDITLLFLFRFATPSEVGYVFGVLKYDFLKYLALTIGAELPFILLIVYAGEAFIGNQWWTLATLGVAGVTLVLGAMHLLKIARRRRGVVTKIFNKFA